MSTIDIDSGIFEHCVAGNRLTGMLDNQTVATPSKDIIDAVITILT